MPHSVSGFQILKWFSAKLQENCHEPLLEFKYLRPGSSSTWPSNEFRPITRPPPRCCGRERQLLNGRGVGTSWWRYQIETFSMLLAICAGISLVIGKKKTTQRPVMWRFDVLTYAWINGWVNNGEAGELRRRRPHYDVIVMLQRWPGGEPSKAECNYFYPNVITFGQM